MNNNPDMLFSPDGEQFAYVRAKGFRKAVVLNNKEDREYKNITQIAFSPDNKQFVYIAGGEEYSATIVINGKETIYQDAKLISSYFSPDSSHLVCILDNKGGDSFTIDGEKNMDRYNTLAGPFFSPDNKHVAFGVRKMMSLYWIVKKL
jgi:hypothetical protein